MRDYAQWVQQRNLPDLRAYWTGAMAPVVLRAGSSSDRATGTYSYRDVRLPGEFTGRLRAVARLSRVTQTTVMLALFARALNGPRERQGRRDLVIGINAVGLPPDLDGKRTWAGCFVNTLPMRVQVPTTGSLRTWLGKLNDDLAGLIEHRLVGSDEIRQWCGMAPGALFDASFVWQETMESDVLGELTGGFLETGAGLGPAVREPVRLLVAASTNQCRVTIAYAPALCDTETIDRMTDGLVLGMDAVLQQSGIDVGDLPSSP